MFFAGDERVRENRRPVETHLDGVEETEGAAVGLVEEGLPLLHGLEGVHQASVETVRRGSDEAGGRSG